ncbi:cytochrome b [Sphingomonas sp. URHD0057]|uniref:cytochrome b n=1 Tax=Sphingomonas sp. URHD0057 TaxID=1380389 RepID=UPI0006854DE2|nr:cytochrome b/b6 domain-containing protein [Sphingomonas sp. URHD0057]
MDDRTGFDIATRIVAGDDGTNYDGVAIFLHWATAALVIANFALAQVWDWFAKPTRGLLEDTHMSFGVLLTLVIIARLVWRWIPGHQVSSLEAGWVRLASKATHYLLYVLLAAEAALGFTFRWGAGRPMAFFGSGIPSPVGEVFGRPMVHQLREFHQWIGWTIIVIALLHALAALYHHYVLKDRVLQRMLPSATVRK